MDEKLILINEKKKKGKDGLGWGKSLKKEAEAAAAEGGFKTKISSTAPAATRGKGEGGRQRRSLELGSRRFHNILKLANTNCLYIVLESSTLKATHCFEYPDKGKTSMKLFAF